MAAVQGKMQQAGGVVTGGQEQCKADGAKSGEAPKTAGAPALPHHRRSKSASSGRNLETCNHGGAASHGIVEQRFHRPAQVSQLQQHLHQERSIRTMLDRAIGRASSTLSPGHRHFPAQTKELIAEIELLEEEIANREQHVLTLYRSIFDQCVSGPSSGQISGISSPAHAKSLERVDLSISGTSIKLAFWINVYNSLVMHAFLAYGIPNSSLKRMAIFHKWFESILSTAMRKRCADEKQLVQLKFGLPDCQPLVLFALCTGASSDPMLKVYTAKNVADELERAKREFLQAGVVVRKSRKVYLPRLVERYAKEAGLPIGDGILAWARDNVDGRAAQDAIQRCATAAPGRRRASQAFEWLPYNARFRYAFARSMVDKQAAAVLA
ncbi:hypothetical protein ACQ4PT_031824 [Festuca glaucescens]